MMPLSASDKRPNVLWLIAEDMNDWMSCYGDATVETPVFDRLAQQGVLFKRFYVPAPVCSSSRSGLILGSMQTSFGAMHHRSKVRWKKHSSIGQNHLPSGVAPVTKFFQSAGYETFTRGKLDFNFVHDEIKLNTVKDWNEAAAAGKPWFAQFQLRGGKGGKQFLKEDIVKPADVKLPPYYPDHPVFRELYAEHYNCILGTGVEVKRILDELKKDGQLENTFIFFLSDHGMPGGPRHKQFCYEGGIRVPLIIRWPEKFRHLKPQKSVRTDLVSGIDLAPTSLALAGISPPPWMQGDNIFAADYQQKGHIISARDRCDFTIDRIRAVVTERYKYIRNFYPERPWMQDSYRVGHDPWDTLLRLAGEGKLNEYQRTFTADKRPLEELYDLKDDPHELNNLAAAGQTESELQRHRKILEEWITASDDKGRLPESRESLVHVIYKWRQRCKGESYRKAWDLFRELNEK